jgi:mono/diheme cytochrome c family protein
MLSLLLGLVLVLGCASKLVYLEQNWSPADRDEFWFTPQGSRILPYEWFLNLEAPSGGELFRTGLAPQYGYLPAKKSTRNPDALPIGFVEDGDQLGLTCAACHTNDVQVGRTRIRVDGAPALADYGAFFRDLTMAVRLTAEDDARFARFAARMNSPEEDSNELRRGLRDVAHRLVAQESRDRPESPAGHGRTDAFGEIYNAVLAAALGIEANALTPNAPVSYPFLWDTPHHDRLQWNGSAFNAGAGPLIRNAGEVFGVFGEVIVDPGRVNGYDSSLKFSNLVRLEDLVRELWSPEWPEDLLGKLDAEAVEAGKALYEKGCMSCHARIVRNDPNRKAHERLVPAVKLGTDPTLLEQAGRKALPGRLAGQRIFFGKGECPIECLHGPDEKGAPRDDAFNILGNVVIGALYGGARDSLHPLEEQIGAYKKAATHEIVMALRGGKQLPLPPRYKARPLNGIWATAPYLHNGSVPSLLQLLTPPQQRIEEFKVGSTRFDPKEVGFAYGPSEEGSLLDTRLTGNSNRGHSYGTNLSEKEKWQLIEYLKTL